MPKPGSGAIQVAQTPRNAMLKLYKVENIDQNIILACLHHLRCGCLPCVTINGTQSTLTVDVAIAVIIVALVSETADGLCYGSTRDKAKA